MLFGSHDQSPVHQAAIERIRSIMDQKMTSNTQATDGVSRERRKFIMSGISLASAAVAPSLGVASPAASKAVAGPATRSGQQSAGKRVLIINAHQTYKGISEGRLNRTLAELIAVEMKKKGFELKTTEVEAGYTVQEEVEKHLWADVIVTQSPVFWFGNPWIYKKYVDEVFTAGLMQQSFLSGDGRSKDAPDRQYGSGGKMQGKRYLLSLTMNSPRQAFDDASQHLHQGRSVDDVFASNTANYKFCGAQVLPVFACYDVVNAANVQNDIERLKARLTHEFG